MCSSWQHIHQCYSCLPLSGQPSTNSSGAAQVSPQGCSAPPAGLSNFYCQRNPLHLIEFNLICKKQGLSMRNSSSWNKRNLLYGQIPNPAGSRYLHLPSQSNAPWSNHWQFQFAVVLYMKILFLARQQTYKSSVQKLTQRKFNF